MVILTGLFDPWEEKYAEAYLGPILKQTIQESDLVGPQWVPPLINKAFMFFKMIIIAFSFLFLAQCTNRDDEIKIRIFQYLSATTCIEDYQTINDLNISTVKIYSDSTNQRLLDIPAMWYCSLSPNVVYTELSNDIYMWN